MRLLKSFAITVAILAIPLTSYGWTRTYGGESNDAGNCICFDPSDSCYVILGQLSSFGGLWLLKVDRYGDTAWTKVFEGEGNSFDVTAESNYIVTGVRNDSLLLIMIGSHGKLIWDSTYRFDYSYDVWESFYDEGRSIHAASDGGYIITGETAMRDTIDRDVSLILLKTDSLGYVEWDIVKSGDYSGWADTDWGSSVVETSDGGYVVCGTRDAWYGFNGADLWWFKTDSAGKVLWEYIYDDGDMGISYGNCIRESIKGGYVIVGSAMDEEGLTWERLLMLKVDSMGEIEGVKRYEGQSFARGYWLEQTPDGGYIIVGVRELPRDEFDLWLLKTDVNGDTIWTRTYGGSGHDYGLCVKPDYDGGYIITGKYEKDSYDLWLLKTNEYGDTVWYEGSPREILNPQEGDTISYMIPAAWFKNTGTYPISDFYCHCEIWPWSGDSAACAYLSPPYHIKYWVSYEVEPGDSILIKFSEWMCDDSSRYVASFYTTKESEPIWQTREKSVTFYGEPFSGVVEDQPINLPPHWEIITSCGREIILQYSGYPQGFQASVFDVAGRKVDELRACKPSGTVTWGESAPTGVYFIRASGSQAKEVKRFIIMR